MQYLVISVLYSTGLCFCNVGGVYCKAVVGPDVLVHELHRPQTTTIYIQVIAGRLHNWNFDCLAKKVRNQTLNTRNRNIEYQ